MRLERFISVHWSTNIGALCVSVTKHNCRFLVYGGLVHAPLVYNWLRFAARVFPKDTLKHLLAKVAMDQTMFAPVGLSCFYIGLSAMEGKNKDEVYEEWREKFPNTWAVGISCNIWIIILAIGGKQLMAMIRLLNPITRWRIFTGYLPSGYWGLGLEITIKKRDRRSCENFIALNKLHV